MTRYAINIHEKRLGERTILRNTQLVIAQGETVSLVGPSGCGKSTLLRLVAGLDQDFRGSIGPLPAAAGSVNHAASLPSIGMVFQEPRLLPWLTVADNVGFGLAQTDSTDQRVASVLQEVGLADKGALLPKALSGGMAQRVAIARALVREPQMLLLDEPFSALDIVTKHRLHELVRSVTEKHHTATLMVTHDPDEALDLSDRIYVLGQPGPQGATLADVIDCAHKNRGTTSVERAQLRSRLLAALGVTLDVAA